MTTTYDIEQTEDVVVGVPVTVGHTPEQAQDVMILLERDALRRDIEELKARVVTFAREMWDHLSDPGVGAPIVVGLMERHDLRLRPDDPIPAWLVPVPVDEPEALVMIERDIAREHLAEFLRWRTRAVNIVHRAARLSSWCETFDDMMNEMGLPPRTNHSDAPEGWTYDRGTRRWSYIIPTEDEMPELPDETRLDRFMRERDHARAQLAAYEDWKVNTLQPVARRYSERSQERMRLMRFVGLEPDEDVALIPGEFEEGGA